MIIENVKEHLNQGILELYDLNIYVKPLIIILYIVSLRDNS